MPPNGPYGPSGSSDLTTRARTAKRSAANISSRPIRFTNARMASFSPRSSRVTATVPLASASEPSPASRPVPSTRMAAVSVVPSMASGVLRAAIRYAATTRAEAPRSKEAEIAVWPKASSHPATPPMAPSRKKVRTPAKRAAGPVAWPDHSRSSPTAIPARAATARRIAASSWVGSGSMDPGLAGPRGHDGVEQWRRIESHRIGAGEPGVPGRRVTGGAGGRVVEIVGVHRNRDDLGGVHRRSDRLVQLHVVRQGRDPEPGRTAVFANVLPAGLVAEDQRAGAGSVQQAQSDAGISRVIDASLPFHQDDVGPRRRLKHQIFGGAGDEVRHHRVHRGPPALDEDAGLPGGHEPGV